MEDMPAVSSSVEKTPKFLLLLSLNGPSRSVIRTNAQNWENDATCGLGTFRAYRVRHLAQGLVFVSDSGKPRGADAQRLCKHGDCKARHGTPAALKVPNLINRNPRYL